MTNTNNTTQGTGTSRNHWGDKLVSDGRLTTVSGEHRWAATEQKHGYCENFGSHSTVTVMLSLSALSVAARAMVARSTWRRVCGGYVVVGSYSVCDSEELQQYRTSDVKAFLEQLEAAASKSAAVAQL